MVLFAFQTLIHDDSVGFPPIAHEALVRILGASRHSWRSPEAPCRAKEAKRLGLPIVGGCFSHLPVKNMIVSWNYDPISRIEHQNARVVWEKNLHRNKFLCVFLKFGTKIN
jgi:hypothetical protein